MICKRCNILMKEVMHFEDGKAYQFRRCPKCYCESKKVPLFFKSYNKEQNKYIKKNLSVQKLQKSAKNKNRFMKTNVSSGKNQNNTLFAQKYNEYIKRKELKSTKKRI